MLFAEAEAMRDELADGLDRSLYGLPGIMARLTFAMSLCRRLVWVGIPRPIWLPLLFWCRMERTMLRLNALARRYQAGTLKRHRPGDERERAEPGSAAAGAGPHSHIEQRAAPADEPARRLPVQFGWLRRRVRETGMMEQALLDSFSEWEFLAFLQAAPQAIRMLRPLCRMLGMQLPAILHLPKQQRRKPLLEAPRKVAREQRPSYAQMLRRAISSAGPLTRIPSADWGWRDPEDWPPKPKPT